MKRRTFLIHGMSATALAFAPLARTRAARASVRSTQSRSFDIAVVGAGMFGSAAARHLSADADWIALIGPDEPPRRRTHQGVFASHYDATRLVRIADPDLIWATPRQAVHRAISCDRADQRHQLLPRDRLHDGDARSARHRLVRLPRHARGGGRPRRDAR